MSFVKSADTSVPVGRSQSQMEKLLRRYGCSGFGISTDYRSGKVSVTFVVPDSLEDGAPDVPVRLEVSIDKVAEQLYGQKRRRNTEAERSQAERVAWRHLNLWIDAALSAAASGVQKVSDAFFAHTLVLGNDGATRRLTDHLDAATGGNWRGLLAPPAE